MNNQRNMYNTKKWNIEHECWEDELISEINSLESCKSFGTDFEHFLMENWFDSIKTKCPCFTSVMNGQKWPEEVQKFLCILIGRMMYKTGELDNWQVVPCLIGRAGTGKSTILDNIVKLLYRPEDIGTVQKNFDHKLLEHKKIFVYPEISKLDKNFQQICTAKFTAPGILVGNELPKLTENMKHNFVIFMFEHKILNNDNKLGMKIQKEIAYIIQSCNRGYLETIKEHRKTDIWKILPEYFKETQKKFLKI